MAKPIWPFSRFNTDLGLPSVDGYRVIENLRTNQPPRFVSYLVLVGLLGLLVLAVYFKLIDQTATALAMAGIFVGVILLLLVLDRLLTHCTQCAGKLVQHSAVVPSQRESYRVSGHVCRSCRVMEIYFCINTKLESDIS
jgi:hypothetical protein